MEWKTSAFLCFVVSFLVVFWDVRTKVCAFNIEEREPIVKRGLVGSYFGFSVAQHQTLADNKGINWILVGAPLGQNLQPGTNHSGALYKCPVSQRVDDCIQVETDGRRFNDFDYSDAVSVREPIPLEPPGPDEIKDGQWLGVSVRSQKPGGKVMVCAHRYIQSPNLQLHHYGLGLCYLLKNDLEAESELQPCKGRPMEKLHQQYGFCQVGTSLALLDDGVALMGSPGPYTWRGTVFAKKVVGDFLDTDMTTYHGPLNDDAEPIQKYSYVGMSVAGGYFFSRNYVTYVSGAPRSQLFGEIFFFQKEKQTEQLNITYTLRGEQFASSFGYEVLAVDLNKDGYDDLLVGAPFYYSDNHGGAVYIYTNLKECPNHRPEKCQHTVLKGKSESRFGFSMTALGDVNKDGYVDIAIGAPYDNGVGAIYIYLGSPNGLNKEPSQVIKRANFRTMGYSLSGGLDMDNNGYPDLLVGAYDSDMAILYKTRPIIDITITIKGEELKNINATKRGCSTDPDNTDNACFTFQSCFRMNDLRSPGSFKVKYEIREKVRSISRIWFRDDEFVDKRSNNGSRFITVRNVRDEYCQEETVYIREGIGDILSPIKFVVNYTLANNKAGSPILNKTSVKEFQATFQKSCGDDDLCESNLVLSAGSMLESSPDGYILDLGKNDEFLLDANVTNFGESAYEAKLFVVHPEELSYIIAQETDNNNKTTICAYENDTLVICNLGNPFQEHKSVFLRLRFEIKNTKKQKLDLHVFVNSTSTELSQHTSERVTAIVQKIAKYTIEGKAITPHLLFSGEVKGESAMKYFEDVGARVHHQYLVNNKGQWQLENLEVEIHWPYQVFSERKQGGKWLLYLEEKPKITGIDNYCSVNPKDSVNPLGLQYKLGPPTVEAVENSTEAYSFVGTPEQAEGLRKRRDVEYVVSAESRVEPDGNTRRIVTMGCDRTARCAKLTCRIKTLNKKDEVRIDIFSRLWNSTLIEDYSDLDWISINSQASVLILDPTIVHSNDSIGSALIETKAFPQIIKADTGLNIWIIVGSVLAGVLVLLLLIFILYKVGFFKRNRIKDQTLSGNLKKQGESESLLKVNEGKT